MKKTKLKAASVEVKLRIWRGNMSAAADELRVHRSTVLRFVRQRPKLLQIVNALRAQGEPDSRALQIVDALRAQGEPDSHASLPEIANTTPEPAPAPPAPEPAATPATPAAPAPTSPQLAPVCARRLIPPLF